MSVQLSRELLWVPIPKNLHLNQFPDLSGFALYTTITLAEHHLGILLQPVAQLTLNAIQISADNRHVCAYNGCDIGLVMVSKILFETEMNSSRIIDNFREIEFKIK